MTKWERLVAGWKSEGERRKPAIANELKNGASREFYRKCIMENAAFDVTAGGVKYEFCPARSSYLNGGAEARYGGAESDYCWPVFDDGEILGILSGKDV